MRRSGGLAQKRVVEPETRIVADPQLGGMEVAQDGGQAAHVVGVGMTERDGIEMANAARPERWRDHFFADVELRRCGCTGGFFIGIGAAAGRPPASAATIDEKSFAVGGDERSESPWPTSMASTSRASRGCWRGRGATASESGGNEGSPGARRCPFRLRAPGRWRRPEAGRTQRICQAAGPGMRTSPMASEPNRCTSPTPRWRSTATAAAGTTAAGARRAARAG